MISSPVVSLDRCARARSRLHLAIRYDFRDSVFGVVLSAPQFLGSNLDKVAQCV